MVEAMKRFSVIYERDEAGWWVATAKGVAGAHTQGRSIKQARSRIREVLELARPELRQFELDEQIELPSKAKQVIAQREAAQKRLAQDELKARTLTQRAVKTLVQDLALSVRDAGALLGLSHQRIQQLVEGE